MSVPAYWNQVCGESGYDEELLSVPTYIRNCVVGDEGLRHSYDESILEIPTVMRKNLQASDRGPRASSRTLVIGVGGAGARFVGYLQEREMAGVDLLQVDYKNSDDSAIEYLANLRCYGGACSEQSSPIPRVLFSGPKSSTKGWSELENHMVGYRAVVIYAGIGGKCGSELAPAIAELALKKGEEPLLMVVTPFNMEGAARRKRAEQALRRLSNMELGVLNISNQQMIKMCQEAGLESAFEYVHRQFEGALDKVIMTVSRNSRGLQTVAD